jgi:hypothetical protein
VSQGDARAGAALCSIILPLAFLIGLHNTSKSPSPSPFSLSLACPSRLRGSVLILPACVQGTFRTNAPRCHHNSASDIQLSLCLLCMRSCELMQHSFTRVRVGGDVCLHGCGHHAADWLVFQFPFQSASLQGFLAKS